MLAAKAVVSFLLGVPVGVLSALASTLGPVCKQSRLVDHDVVIRRPELSDAEWDFARPLLPESVRGRKRLDDRRVLNGMVWKFRTGTAWRACPSATARGPRSIRVSAGGRRTARSTECCGPPRRRRTRRATSTGSSRWSPRSSVPTSTRPESEKGVLQPGPWPAQRRTDQQDPPGLRRQRPSPGLCRYGRQHQRLHPVHHRDGSDPGALDRTGTPPRPARSRPGRQGIQLESDPYLAPPPGHRAHDSRAGRPGP